MVRRKDEKEKKGQSGILSSAVRKEVNGMSLWDILFGDDEEVGNI